MKFDEWKGFIYRNWNKEIDVRDFIQVNYTNYEGDSSFLVGPTDRTSNLWEKTLSLMEKEKDNNGVLDIDVDTVSTITSHKPRVYR